MVNHDNNTHAERADRSVGPAEKDALDTGTRPAMRADARENRKRILSVAAEFLQQIALGHRLIWCASAPV